MKPGHRKRFAALLKREEKIRQDQAEREEKIREAKKKEEEHQAEREEKIREAKKKEEEHEQEHEHQLAKARRRKELEAEEAGAATDIGNQHGTQGEMKTETIDKNLNLAATDKTDKTRLPKDKQFHSFISHKKVTAIHFKCFAPAAC